MNTPAYFLQHYQNIITDSLIKSKRKNIDIRPETFRMFSIKAAEQGTNLKRYIESLLDSKVDEEEDLLLYNAHVKDNPECWEFLDDTEQTAFEKEIGLCR